MPVITEPHSMADCPVRATSRNYCPECIAKAKDAGFTGYSEAGERTPSGRLILGNFNRMRDAHEMAAKIGAIVKPYLNGKYARGWTVQTIEIDLCGLCTKKKRAGTGLNPDYCDVCVSDLPF